MIEQHMDIETADGLMNTFITYPDENGPFPVVLFYMDAPGIREELHDMARRLASVGYYVLLPNLYYRKARDFRGQRNDVPRDEIFAMMGHLTNTLIVSDTAALIDYVDHQSAATATRIGAVGYCMSGPFVIAAAGRYPERIQCAASIYGANLLTDADDSAHLLGADASAELYFACAEIDQWAPQAQIEQLDQHLNRAGVNYRIEWYPGAEHGFAFPQRGGIYHKPSAERHWARLFALFDRNLRSAD